MLRLVRRCLLFVGLIVTLVWSVLACGIAAPEFPSDPAASYERLTGKDGRDFLARITTYRWSDKGAGAAASFAWIGRDALSQNKQAATRAGQAAHAIAAYLADQQNTLVNGLSTGWFQSGHQSLGQRNPDLVRGYAFVLSPFQGGMVGDLTGTSGFEPLSRGPGDYSPVRNVFAVIDTDTQAGNKFTSAAYEKVDAYLHEFAIQATNNSPTTADLDFATVLSGVAEGGAHTAGNPDIRFRTEQESYTLAAYTLAAALRPHPGIIDQKFFVTDGLKPPHQVPEEDLSPYTSQLQQFLNQNPQFGLTQAYFYPKYKSAEGGE